MTIPADDAELIDYLESANLPALLPALVQLTGDTSLLQRFSAPTPGMMGAVDGAFSSEEQVALRALAFDVLKAHRDGDGSVPRRWCMNMRWHRLPASQASRSRADGEGLWPTDLKHLVEDVAGDDRFSLL